MSVIKKKQKLPLIHNETILKHIMRRKKNLIQNCKLSNQFNSSNLSNEAKRSHSQTFHTYSKSLHSTFSNSIRNTTKIKFKPQKTEMLFNYRNIKNINSLQSPYNITRKIARYVQNKKNQNVLSLSDGDFEEERDNILIERKINKEGNEDINMNNIGSEIISIFNGEYRRIRNVDIEEIYNRSNIPRDTQNLLKKELFKANKKVCIWRKKEPIIKVKKEKQKFIRRSYSKGIRISVAYNTENEFIFKKDTKKKTIKTTNRIHEFNLGSKMYMSTQNPVLQINTGVSHFNIMNDYGMMSEFLLHNFSNI